MQATANASLFFTSQRKRLDQLLLLDDCLSPDHQLRRGQRGPSIEFDGQERTLMDRTVGIVGLGIMGGAIARNLVARRWRVVGFDIDAARRAELLSSKPTQKPRIPPKVTPQPT